jgi:uncharacterized protein (DUF488 family)
MESAKHPLYTIGFTQKSARQFFELLEQHQVTRLIDVRANNTSQLAGFTKRDDLAFFLDRILGIAYEHREILAPTPEIRSTLKDKQSGWPEYERLFNSLLVERSVLDELDRSMFASDVCCLLCSEATAEQCHRRLVAEHLSRQWPELRVHHI